MQAEARPQPAAVAPGCRLCMACQGAGTVAEPYNQRLLERSCAECGGQGTLRAGASGQASSQASARSGAHERLAGWEAELAALKQSLAGASDSRELELKAALILELERAAAGLRQRLGGAAAVRAAA